MSGQTSAWHSSAIPPNWLDQMQRMALLFTALLFSAGYAAIGLVLILLAVAAEGIAIRRLPWVSSPVDLFTASFISIFLISGWTSQYRPIAIGSTALAAMTIYLAYGLLHRVLRRDPRFLRPFLGVWVVGAILAAGWAFVLHRVTGHPAFTPVLAQNGLATTALIGFILSLGVFLTVRTGWRYVFAGGSIILALALAVSISRGAWVAVIVGLASFFVLLRLKDAWQGLVIVLLAAVAVILITTPERGRLLLRATTITTEARTHDRILLARAAEAMFVDHPILGTGMNTFSLLHVKYKLPGDTNVAPPFAHNIFLNMAAEGGALGLVAFSFLVLWAAATGWRWAKSRSTDERILSATVLAVFLGLLVHQQVDGTILTVHIGTGFWFLIAIVAAFRPDRRRMG